MLDPSSFPSTKLCRQINGLTAFCWPHCAPLWTNAQVIRWSGSWRRPLNREPHVFKDGLLKSQRILVTGGSTGLGKEMAAKFLELGAEVFICGRRKSVC